MRLHHWPMPSVRSCAAHPARSAPRQLFAQALFALLLIVAAWSPHASAAAAPVCDLVANAPTSQNGPGGGTLNYTFGVTCSFGSPNVNVAVSIPFDGTGGASVTTPSGGTFTAIGAGASYPFTVQLGPNPGFVSIQINCTAGTALCGTTNQLFYSARYPRVLNMTLTKVLTSNADGDGSGSVTPGDVLTYTITSTNTGNVPLTNVTINDPLITPNYIACPNVPVNSTCVLVGTYTVTATDLANGYVINTAQSTSNELCGDSCKRFPVTLRTRVFPPPAMTVTKVLSRNTDGDHSGNVTLGDTLIYTVTATNTGAIALNNVVVNDPLLSPGTVTCTTVPIRGRCLLTGSYTVTATDVSNGSIINTGNATANGIPGTLSSNTVTTQVFGTASMTVAKALTNNADGDGSGTVTQGDVLTYTVTATNTGTTTLNNVQVSDPLTAPNLVTCPSVAPGATCVLSGLYTVTATDVANGAITNTGQASSNTACAFKGGAGVLGQATTASSCSSTLRTPVTTYKAMTLSKALTNNADGDGSGNVTLGDVLTFTVTATNTGNVTLTNVQVSDPLTTPNSASCATVAPGASCVLAGTYTVTAADASRGSITNTGSAVSTEIPSRNVTLRTPVFSTPKLTVSKTLTKNADGDHSNSVTAGDVLTFTVTATNTGNVPLTNVQVTDPLTTPNAKTCPSVAVGATCVLTGTYTVTATDAANGAITNTGKATSNEFCSEGCTYFSSVLRTPVTTAPPSNPAMTVVKQLTGNADGDKSGTVTLGDVLTYTVTATNTGNITLTNVHVSDALTTPSAITCASVAVGATCVLSGTYTVTATDVSNGAINNTGTASANQLTGQASNSISTPVVGRRQAMTVVKKLTHNADGDRSGTVSVGDVLTFKVTATNTGNVPLTNVQVTDPLTTPNAKTCPSVAVGATCVLTGTYTVTATDAANGAITNTGTATSNEFCGDSCTYFSSVLRTPVPTAPPSNPAMTVVKQLTGNADGDHSGTVTVGDVLTYTVTATNTGNVTLTTVHVTDPLTTPSAVTCATVAVGATCVLSGTYTVTASDASAGSISNTGSASADQLPNGGGSSSLNTPVAATVAYQITILSGNGQSAAPGHSLPQDFVVAVTQPILAANATHAQASTQAIVGLSGIPVQWQILSGGGSLSNGGSTTTGPDGHSSNHYTLGNGIGLNQVRVTVPGGASVTFNATSVASSALLKIVSGDGQTLTTNTPSAPLVVQLLNNGLPVPNAVIAWSANNAILASATSITDSNGRATNTASVQNPGSATVTASSSAPAAGPVTFGLNGGISHMGGLTHQEAEVANALDRACAALAASSSLTPAEQDFLRQCDALAFSAGADPDKARNALNELFSNIAFLQFSAALLVSNEQFDNIKARIAALRSGTGGTHFGGLAFSTPNGTLPIGSVSDSLLGLTDAKSDDKQKQEVGTDFDRWGFFAAGTFGKGSADPRQVTPGFGFHTNGLTAGVDYRYNDHMIFGVSAGYAKYASNADAGRGGLDAHGWSVSAYSTLFKQDSWYLDSVLTYGSNTYDITRRIIYTLTTNAGTTTVDQTATANSSGNTLAGALTLGRDFAKGPWSFGPYFRGTYTRIAFDNYQEILQSGNGNGLGLSIQSRDLKSVASVLGAKVNFASSQNWGILMPHAEVEWEHEYQTSPDSITARFLHDPTATAIQISGDSIDTNFFRVGLGLSFVLPKGRSGFIYYEKTLGRSGITQDNLAIGIRLEF